MPIQPVAGPAGAGKSQWIARNRRPGDVVIDHTALWAALTGAERGPDGRYPPREDDDATAPFVQYLMATAVRRATAAGLSGFVTTSRRGKVAELEAETGEAAVIVDPGRQVAEDRLRDPETGELSAACSRALARWYDDA